MRLGLWLLTLFVLPILVSAGFIVSARADHWSRARWDATGMAPAPDEHPEAVIQVYAARTWGWKGALAVHSWIAFKPEGAAAYDRYEVVGWGVDNGAPAVRRNLRPPDGRWAGNDPTLLLDLRGPEAAALIPKLQDAIARYPYARAYLTWPGPNSNTFVAWLGREVPELGWPCRRPRSARTFSAVNWRHAPPAAPVCSSPWAGCWASRSASRKASR